MKPRLLILALALASLAAVRSSTAAPRPNYLVILADDYTYNDLRDGQWRYIRNLTPGELYIEKHVMDLQGGGGLNNPYWPTWVGDAWDQPVTYRLVKRYMSRPAEELYHTAADPYEMNNLAADARHSEIKARLLIELDRWLAAQADPGIPQDTHEAHRVAQQGNHLYYTKP